MWTLTALIAISFSPNALMNAGGCCLQNGACVDSSAETCAKLGGAFMGSGNYCFENPALCDSLELGSCCIECPPVGQQCEDQITESSCSDLGGMWSPSTSCTESCALIYDCNEDGIDDFCQDTMDINSNDVPDECECISDLDKDNQVGWLDLLLIVSQWGSCGECGSDIIANGQIDAEDLMQLISDWGPC